MQIYLTPHFTDQGLGHMTNPQISTTSGIIILLWNNYSKNICSCRVADGTERN